MAMITNETLAKKYPLTIMQKELLLNPDLIRVVLSAGINSKEFG
jgi:hypothetical protein